MPNKLTTKRPAAVAYHVARTHDGVIHVTPDTGNTEDAPSFALSPIQAVCLASQLLEVSAHTVVYAIEDSLVLHRDQNHVRAMLENAAQRSA